MALTTAALPLGLTVAAGMHKQFIILTDDEIACNEKICCGMV